MPIDLSRSATSMTPAEVDEARAWREPVEPDATRGAPDPEATRAIERAAAIPKEQIEAQISPESHALVIAAEISSREAYDRKYKHPEYPGGASGVTIGFGYDIGQLTHADFSKAWSGLIAEGDYQRLDACCGITGASARSKLGDVDDITIPWETAEKSYHRYTVEKFGRLVAGAFPNTMELHPHSFGALYSLVYNRGAGMSGDRRVHMRNIRDHMKARKFKLVPDEFRAMKQLWVGQFAGLVKRREDEARLFEQGLAAADALAAAPAPSAAAAAAAAGAPKPPASVASEAGAPVAPASAAPQAVAAAAAEPFTPAGESPAGPAEIAETRAGGRDEEGDGRYWDESFERDTPDHRDVRRASEWANVHWVAKDEESTEYRHIGASPLKGTAFELAPEDLDLLIAANGFQPLETNGRIMFALRGAELVAADTDPQGRFKQVGRPLLRLREARPDHQHFRCVIGIYEPVKRQLSGFIATTVPCRQAVHSFASGGDPSNMLPTGCYAYVVGAHKSYQGCLRENEDFTVLRSRRDFAFDIRDDWDCTFPADNLHPAFANQSAEFSSWGCQTIRGSCTDGEFSGEYREFRKVLGLTKPGSGDHGLKFSYVMLTGLEAAIAADHRKSGAGKPPAGLPAGLGRLRHGSRGDRVKALQARLAVPVNGVFDARLKKVLADHQKKKLGWADGIHSPEMDKLLGFDVFAAPVAAAAAPPAAAPVVIAPTAPAKADAQPISPDRLRRALDGEPGHPGRPTAPQPTRGASTARQRSADEREIIQADIADRLPKVALVIGNSAYEQPLSNPANDAALIKSKLEQLGFAILYGQNVTRKGKWTLKGRLSDSIAEGATVVIYYAGHGIQCGDVNFLVPVDAQLDSRDPETELVRLGDLIETATRRAGKAGHVIVLLDACRNNPFTDEQMAHLTRSVSLRPQAATPAATQPAAAPAVAPLGRGLALHQVASSNDCAREFIAYATAPGAVAYDGEKGERNSPFAEAIGRHMLTRGLAIEELISRVGIDVQDRVKHRLQGVQDPWTTTNLKVPFYFRPHTWWPMVAMGLLGMLAGAATCFAVFTFPDGNVADPMRTPLLWAAGLLFGGVVGTGTLAWGSANPPSWRGARDVVFAVAGTALAFAMALLVIQLIRGQSGARTGALAFTPSREMIHTFRMLAGAAGLMALAGTLLRWHRDPPLRHGILHLAIDLAAPAVLVLTLISLFERLSNPRQVTVTLVTLIAGVLLAGGAALSCKPQRSIFGGFGAVAGAIMVGLTMAVFFVAYEWYAGEASGFTDIDRGLIALSLTSLWFGLLGAQLGYCFSKYVPQHDRLRFSPSRP